MVRTHAFIARPVGKSSSLRVKVVSSLNIVTRRWIVNLFWRSFFKTNDGETIFSRAELENSNSFHVNPQRSSLNPQPSTSHPEPYKYSDGASGGHLTPASFDAPLDRDFPGPFLDPVWSGWARAPKPLPAPAKVVPA